MALKKRYLSPFLSPFSQVIERILETSSDREPVDPGEILGLSRQGREIRGFRLGRGELRVSLIGGCHADEPVGPEMLRRLAAFLATRPEGDPLLRDFTWYLVPHVNPDGEARNAVWSEKTVAAVDSHGEKDRVFDLAAYLRQVLRELPGEDIEFGFPREERDAETRPENRAVADFLRGGAPFALHATFHGMAFAPGPWFLIEPAWVERTATLRERLRQRVRAMGFRLFDVDRGGEKGFFRIDEGFSTRPDSRAMATFFEERGDPDTAALFRPSSMEYIRSLGGDPFTLVSEMPLFLLPDLEDPSPDLSPDQAPPWIPGKKGKKAFFGWLNEITADEDPARVRARTAAAGLRAMPIRDQMRLQIAFLAEALKAVSAA